MNKLYFEPVSMVEVEVEKVAQELADANSEVQGVFFTEFFSALWKVCGAHHGTLRQASYIADGLEEDTARWLIQLGRDALAALDVKETEGEE